MEASFASELSWAVSSMSSTRTLQQLRQVGASVNQLHNIRDKFLRIQSYIEVLSQGGSEEPGVVQPAAAGLNTWLKHVNDLIFYVEDTINEYLSEDRRRKSRAFKKTSLFSLPTRMSYRVCKILLLLDKIDKKAFTLGLTILEVSRANSIALDQEPDLRIPENYFETGNVRKIIDTLANSRASDNGIFTIAIVGMAGIGKSTLARKVYSDRLINNHFRGNKMWVTVGDNFDATRILKKMFSLLPEDIQQSMPEESQNPSGYMVSIKTKLRDFMKGKNSLIVLDDVLCVTQEQIQNLYALQSDGGRITILVTIRREEVVLSFVDPEIHHVKRLTVEDSWELFKSVFSKEKGMPIEEGGSELETTGKRISGKCYGIPRVITEMAGSLGRLENVADLNKWETDEAETELWKLIMSTLSLKLNTWSKAQRQCYSYCSIFPENATIGKLDLISLWIAQGFVTEEATAEKYFNNLLNKSLLQVCTHDEDGNVLDCTMHDVAYNLAVKLSRHDHFRVTANGNNQNIQPVRLFNVRHLTISPPKDEHVRDQQGIITVGSTRRRHRLRTIYIMVQQVPVENFLSQARLLYVLKLDGIGLTEVPKDLHKLKYLRYLDLSNNQITSLPESITQLHLLQTLRLLNCINISSLSEGIYSFISKLLYAEIPPKLYCKSGTSTTQRYVDPVCLTAKEASKQLSNVGSRNDTAGLLCISGLEHVKLNEDAQRARISFKSKLSSLELCWNRPAQLLECSGNDDEKVLEGLQPHPNIRRLKLTNYGSQHLPKWVMRPMKGDDNDRRRLNSLVRIVLVNCKKCQTLPSMGELPCLQELIIDGMTNVERVGEELYHHVGDIEEKDELMKVFFPALKRLELRGLSKLKEWQPSHHMVEAFTRLDTLQVVDCPNLSSIPTDFARIKNLLIQGVRVENRGWLDTIISNSSSKHTLISLVLNKVSGLISLPRELFQCTTLEQLRLQKCENLSSWPGNPWNPISLKELCIDRCSSLTYSPDGRYMTSLKTLVIRGCNNLLTPPVYLERCTSLTKLSISNCNKLRRIQDLGALSCLEELDILDCLKMVSVPQRLDSLTSLRTMRIGGDMCNLDRFFPNSTTFQSLETLWLKGVRFMDSLPQQLKNLSRLKVLRLQSFTSLHRLPDWLCDDLVNLEILIFEECNFLCELPSQTKLMQLRKLRSLRIEKCNNLKSSYNKDGGNKWKDICHIPHIKFDNQWLQGDRSSILQENPINTRVAEQRETQSTNNHQEHEHHNDNNENIWKDGFYVLAFFLGNIFIIICVLVCWAIYKQ